MTVLMLVNTTIMALSIPHFLSTLLSIIFFIIAILLMRARYLDQAKSPFWLLLLFIPLVGPIVVVFQLTLLKSKINYKKELQWII